MDTHSRSRRVQTVLRLEARVRQLFTRYDRALGAAARAFARTHAEADEAHAIEQSLTGSELAELHRTRAELTRLADAARAAASRQRPSTTTR